MERSTTQLSFLFMCYCFLCHGGHIAVILAQRTKVVDVGVVLDLKTLDGRRSWASISMARDDFYAANDNYTTRVALHAKDSDGGFYDSVSATLDILKSKQVQAIIGATTSAEAEFVADLATRAQVPILSFSATSQPLSSSPMPYFVRAAQSDSSLAAAIAAIIHAFGWPEAIPIYQNTGYGSGIVPSLLAAFHTVDVRIPYCSRIPSSPSDDQIMAELQNLKRMQTSVFVVHATQALGSRLFAMAGKAGMMSEGYVWIVTDWLGNVVDTMDLSSINNMQGVLGVRPYVPEWKVDEFRDRWMVRFRQQNPSIVESLRPSISELWAYDTVWALAMAAEKAAATSGPQAGPRLLQAISDTRFSGVSGEFRLAGGQLPLSAGFEVVNVIGRGRGVGFWTPAAGLSRRLNSSTELDPPSSSMADLKAILWPGESTHVPKGWQINPLRISVPMKHGFNGFVNVQWNPINKQPHVTGYCFDVFDTAIRMLPYPVPYKFVPFRGLDVDDENVWSYNDLVYQVSVQELEEEKIDAVVGDVTITLNRTLQADFTWSFAASGVSMVVRNQDDNGGMWVFLKPLTTDLWIGSITFFLFTGFTVWLVEHRINPQFRGPPLQQLGLVLYFSFSTLVYAHKEKLKSNLSRLTLTVWVFVVLILTSSYTASLTTIMLTEIFKPTADVATLLKNGDRVGYQMGSHVGDLLKQLSFVDDKIVPLRSSNEYAEALTKGSEDGGVAAVFDEIPYLTSFVFDHCGDYTIASQTFKMETQGFGFAFRKGSLLAPEVSRAILSMMESGMMIKIERKWFGECTNSKSKGLSFRRFRGLFLITGIVSLYALLVFLATFVYKEYDELKYIYASEVSLWRTMVAWIKHYDQMDLNSHFFTKEFNVKAQVRQQSTLTEEAAAAAATTTTTNASSSQCSSSTSDPCAVNITAS